LNWQAWGTCGQVDPELWFPEKGTLARRAVTLCRQCAVRVECLADALVNGENDGVRAGFTPRDRRPIVRAFKQQRPDDVERFAERVIMMDDQLIEETECAA
jgi:WhiB family redox-sensing transcriptional regulator